eukprot:7270621-Prorocentrum_lima.AAC.1
MTSSLVGSEMCIRDRFIGVQGHYVLEVLERFSSSMHYKPRSTPGEPESCLLYTSDAADDM